MVSENSNHQSKEHKEDKPSDIAGMASDIGADYDSKKKPPVLGQDIPEKAKKQMDETKKKLEKFKKDALKKYDFIMAIGIIPPQAAEKFDEEFGLTPEEKKEKPMHLAVIIPEEKFKELTKIKAEIISMSKDIKPKLWLNIITPVDLWNYCLDSKYDVVEAIGMSYPLHDKAGIFAGLRAAEIHKSLCLRKFEKYIYSYVIAGSFVRGDVVKTSDVDIFVVIDDTDVKRMPRIELKEKLRGIIYQYIAEAEQLAGVKNMLNIQVYLLTEFWEDVKDASPVIFTFIREGVTLYDRGGFLPWKLLLKMGKIKPSPEAIEKFMSMGEETKKIVQRRLLDIIMGDIYWSVLTPSQALLMLYGLPPPTTKETFKVMNNIFVEKEKMLEKKYIDILEKITIGYYKGYEHGKIKEVTGKEVDDLLKDAEDYMKRLKELRGQIEKRTQEKTIKEIYDNVFKVLSNLFGKKSEQELVKCFEKEMVKKGRADPKNLHVLHELIDVKKKYNAKKKPTVYEIETIRKNASYLINQLIEYGQRCDLHEIRKMQVRLSYGKNRGETADVFLTNPLILVDKSKMKKLADNNFIEASQEEFESIIHQQKTKHPEKLSEESLKALKKELGDFDIVF